MFKIKLFGFWLGIELNSRFHGWFYFRFIATALTVHGSEKDNQCSKSLDVVLTTASFQATECLYIETSHDNNSSPQYIEVNIYF